MLVALIARERDAEEDILIHVCPSWFMQAGETGVRQYVLVS